MTPHRGTPPAEGGPPRADFAEAFHPIEDGLALEYRDYRPAGGGGGKLPVVCLHALSRNLKDYEEVAPAIAQSGRRVVVPSLRGRGRSSWDPKPDRYHPGTYAADVTSLLDALAISRAVFVGTSLGGIVTMALAAGQPQRVAAAVLNDVGGDLAPAGLERIKRYVGRGTPAKTWSEAAAKSRAVNTIAFPKETGEAFWLTFARRTRVETEGGIVLDYDPAIGETMRAAPPAAPGALWPLFEALKPIPTLVVRGAISDLLTRETLAEMRTRKPDLATVEVPDVGHAPLLTEPPAMAALMSFLARVD